MTILLWAVAALLGAGVVWWGSGLLEVASERLAAFYQLPAIVQGAIIVAVGSSFPELATTVLATSLHGKFELGVAAVVGSALFNILVIPAVSGLSSREQLRANRDLVYKEAQFYMIAVAVLLLTFALAAIYYPQGGVGGPIRGEVTRGLAIAPLIFYAVYVFVQYQDTLDYVGKAPATGVSPAREWVRLGVSLMVILAGVEALVRAAVQFGDYFGTPSFLWGMTVVAMGTSVPDAFVSIRAARNGLGVTSIANVLGSNTFDLLVCIPVGVLIAGAVIINFSVAVALMAALTVATLVLFVMLRTRMTLSSHESVMLLAIYAGFIIWIGCETFGVIDWVPHLPP